MVFRTCCAAGILGGALWAWTNRGPTAPEHAVWQPYVLAIGAGLAIGALVGAVLAHVFRS